MRSRRLRGISRNTFERIKHDLRARGVSVPAGDAFIVEHRGARASLAYFESDERVHIHILRKPLFVPDVVVWDLLDRAMRRYRVEPEDEG